MNGIIVVNKEKGYTSHDVVAVLRGVLHEKKIGHTGTLDPDATGVLPVCVGYATKICDSLLAQTKEYIAGGRLGVVTDTQDIQGTVLSSVAPDVSEEDFRSAVAGFVGTIEQLTPMYSARKIDGVKLVDLARRGITIERSKKTVRVYGIDVLEYNRETGDYKIRVLCQKGTYIRTICNDIGEKLGCGSCMTSLVRTGTGNFRVENSVTINELRILMNSGRIDEALIPIDAMYLGSAPMELAPEYRKYIANGNALEKEWLTPITEPVVAHTDVYGNLLGDSEPTTVRVYLGGEFFAIYKRRGRRYVPLQMYHEVDNEKNRASRAGEKQ